MVKSSRDSHDTLPGEGLNLLWQQLVMRVAVSQYVSCVTEGFALVPRRDRPRGPRSPLGRWASAGRGGVGAAWERRGRGFALGPRDRPQYSPEIAGSSYRIEARGPVSCRVPRGLARVEGHVRRSAGGHPPAEGVGCRLAEWEVDGHLDR